MKLSAIVITKNEEKNIRNCLKSLDFCDERIIIDDYSTDSTRVISRKSGAIVFKRRLKDNYSAQRNYGLKKANAEWLLFVDADERVNERLAGEIKDATANKQYSGYYLKRQDLMFGKELKHGETANVSFVRLARREMGRWKRPVHEIWEIKGKVGKLNQPLFHFPHPTISNFISKINKYTTIEAAFRSGKGKKTSFMEMLLFPVGKFLYNYIVLLGFLDGFPGLVMAYMMSLHSLILRIKVRSSIG